MRVAILLAMAWSASTVACRTTPPRKTEVVDASPSPKCGTTAVVRTTIRGRLERDPALRVAIDVGGSTPPEGEIATLSLASPRFAAEYAIEDLCTDDGSTPERIAIRCITAPEGKIARLVVTRRGGGLAVTTDGNEALWMPASFDSKCFELHGLDLTTALEPLARSWRRDEPRCPRSEKVPAAPLTLLVDAVRPAENVRCKPGGARGRSAHVTLVGAGAPRDLGLLDLCGTGGFFRVPDGNGIELSASDSEPSTRFAYQLGDRAYYAVGDGHVRAADLPCGARAHFGVRAPGLGWSESEPP